MYVRLAYRRNQEFCTKSHRNNIIPTTTEPHHRTFPPCMTMRRSKSNPAKYARNYRSISQRRMTEYDDADEEKEIERLRSILKDSEEHLQGHAPDDDNTSRNKLARQSKVSGEDGWASKSISSSILSQELSGEMAAYGEDDPLVVLPPKKKKTKMAKTVELTPQEIRQAKLLQKNYARKLKQLSDRAEQKKKRTDLYAMLKEHAISPEEMQLLSSSSTLGKRETTRETLKRLLQRERAGVPLTTEEKHLLYQEREVVDDRVFEDSVEAQTSAAANTQDQAMDNTEQVDSDDEAVPEQMTKRKKKKRKRDERDSDGAATTQQVLGASDVDEAKKSGDDDRGPSAASVDGCEPKEILTKDEANLIAAPADFAAQMMASLSSLKVKSTTQKEEREVKAAEEANKLEAERLQEEEKQNLKRSRYVPKNPAVLKTAAAIGLDQSIFPVKRRTVLEVNRPAGIQAVRYDLPVSGMEFEIMDAIRNNDVTILCGETGSGKSTQVPQFLYEAGFTLNERRSSEDLLIGVTQPRRVAAVSTAKRVCYEMGHGDGHVIKKGPAGNLVAYQTRYETAGLGRDTQIKFMTDGILLQEIQSDLLLRKYGAIVLDEAHERNLNTDVLLGLLSVAVPLRRKAASEEGSHIGPLKLVIMSATLRVEDFTENNRLFPNVKLALVKVPGRTHPVTIHHSKITELDDYEAVTFHKVCKIHRKLPKGGILVFLTGKQEIVRMVNRLRRSLSSEKESAGKNINFNANHDVRIHGDSEAGCVPRDLDDEEIDGDIFQDDEHDDFEDMQSHIEEDIDEADESKGELDNKIPNRVQILPLYSMLSVEEQARVFDNVPEGVRLIVVATNIAETSITIPDISYVVDSGRQKCRNYHAGTGVASYDVMWISRAAADQRAGRAGRTGPGHCYRMYSSSMYSRHMSAFALPEVLTRPLEDVVLAMKAMHVSNVADFPFPTAPDQGQLDAAVKVLANIGCVDLSNVEKQGGDGEITRLGGAVAKLPLGVRYGKMLLVAAQAGVLDYGIVIVAVQSESSPFQHWSTEESKRKEEGDSDEDSLDEVDRNAAEKKEEQRKNQAKSKWIHRGGDILAAVHAVGAFTYAGRGAGGAAEKAACRRFCEDNGLHPVVLERIQKMRIHLARLAKIRLSNAKGIAAKTGGILSTMPPPNKQQENLLLQAIASGLLDNVARLAPPGSITGDHPYSLRTAYLGCSTAINEPLFVDRNSVMFSRDSRRLPQWVCFDSIVRKTTKSGDTVTNMKNITPVDPSWLGSLAKGSHMLLLGEPLPTPLPSYDADNDAILCSVSTKFGSRGWDIPPVQVEMFDALQSPDAKKCFHFLVDDSFRWFARFLLEGKVLPELVGLTRMLNDEPSIITRKKPLKKVALLVSALSSAGVDSAAALRRHWAQVDDKFLFPHLKNWTKGEHAADVKRIWIATVKTNVNQWKSRQAKGASK